MQPCGENLERNYVVCKYVSTNESPTDLDSRSYFLRDLQKNWKTGPGWLKTHKHWPKQLVLQIYDESEREKKIIKETLRVVVSTNGQLDSLLRKPNIGEFLIILDRISHLQIFADRIKS